MTRRLLNLLTVLSLLLCVAVGVLWVRSHWRFDQVESYWPNGRQIQGFPGTRGIEASSLRGTLYVAFIGNSVNTGNQSEWRWRSRPDPRLAEGDFLTIFPRDAVPGFGVSHEFMVVRVKVRHVWPTALAATLPAMRLAGVLANRRRTRTGLCRICGYDLRASPGRCPECGAVV